MANNNQRGQTVFAWSNEELETWVREKVTSDTLPEYDWDEKQVALWARKYFPKVSDKSVNAIVESELTGAALFKLKSQEALVTLYKIPAGPAELLWDISVTLKSMEQDKLVNPLADKVSSLSLGTMTPSQKEESLALVATMTPGAKAEYSARKKGRNIFPALNCNGKAEWILNCLQVFRKTRTDSTTKKLTFDNEPNTDMANPRPSTIKMPLQERNTAIQAAIQTMKYNRENMDSKAKQDHSFFAILAGAGSGKSRLCHEIAQNIEKEFEDVYKVTLDFSNGDHLKRVDLQATHILGLRVAAILLFECKSSELTEYLTETYDLDCNPIANFSFDAVMTAFFKYRSQNGMATLVHLVLTMDEINYVLKDFPHGTAKEMIRIIGNYMCNSDLNSNASSLACQHHLTLLPIISGTIIDYITSEVLATGYHYDFGPVPLLSFAAIKEIFARIFPQNALWLDNQVFKKTLNVLGQVPRCLENIMTVISSMQESQNLDDQLVTTIVGQSYGKISRLYNPGVIKNKLGDTLLKFLYVILSGHKMADEVLSRQEQDKLEMQGIVYRLEQNHILPYPLLHDLLLEYATLIPAHLLPLPGTPFYWQHFEDLEQHLECIRINSFMRVFKKNEVTIKELFKGALVPPKLAKLELKLNKKQYCKEKGQFLGPTAKHEVKTKITIKRGSKDFIDCVVKCADGNPQVDIKSLYDPHGAGRQIMIVKQMKHGLPQDEDAKKHKTIPFVTVRCWLQAAKRLLTNYAKKYHIIYVFITNKVITNIPDAQQWPEDLIVVHHPKLLDYFGPSVFQIASLSDVELNL